MTDLVHSDLGDDMVSIHTIALELDTDTRTVLAYARELHFPARDTSFRLTREQSETLCAYYRLTGGTLPRNMPVETLPGFTPGTIQPEHDPELAAMERRFQVPLRQRHDYRPGSGRSSSHRTPPPPDSNRPPQQPIHRTVPPAQPVLTGLAAEIARVLPQLPATAAKSVAKVWTEQYGLTDQQTIDWLENGLRTNEARVAVELSGYGVEPYHMQIIIRRETVIARLRDGRLTPYRIADLLRREGFLAAA